MYGQAIQWTPGVTLEAMEKSIIQAAYRFYRENKTQTASALGISIRTLDNKLEKYDADRRADEDAREQRKQNDADTLAHFRGKELTRQFATGSSSQWAQPASGTDSGRTSDDGETSPKDGTAGNGTGSGVHVEPAKKADPEHTMSVSERPKVQAVLPRQAGSVRSGKNR